MAVWDDIRECQVLEHLKITNKKIKTNKNK